MSSNRTSLALATTLLGVVFLGSACAGTEVAAAPRESSPADIDLKAAKAATARYASVEQAKKDGYTGANEPCVSSPGGAMGIHYVNPPLLGDPALDVRRPEILVYLPDADGKLKLVAIEYWKADADQDLSTRDDEPTLFGTPFGPPMDGHSPTMPKHYDLHVWLYEDNPSGLFAPFNPSLSCPPAAG